MALNDCAGIDVERVDKSRVSTNPLQSAITVASVIIAERGLCNRPQLIINDDKRIDRFGLSNFSKYGSSATECKNILDGRIQMLITRAGESSWKLAGVKAQSTGLSASSGYTQENMSVNAPMGSDLFRIAAKGEGTWGNNLVLRFADLTEGETFEDADNSRVKRLEIYEFGSPYTFTPKKDSWDIKFKVTTFTEATEVYLQIDNSTSSKITIPANTSVNSSSFTDLLDAALTSMSITGYSFSVKSSTEVNLKAADFNSNFSSVKVIDTDAEEVAKSIHVEEGTFTDLDSSKWAVANSDKLVESFYVSLNSEDLDADGNSMYLLTKLQESNYVYALCNEEMIGAITDWTGVNALDFGDADWTTDTHPAVIALAGGSLSSEQGADAAGFSTKMARAQACKDALNSLLSKNDDYRCFVTINAGQEISNSDFVDVAKNANESTLCIDSLGKSVGMMDETTIIENLLNNDIQVQHDTFLAHYWQWLQVKEASSGKLIFVSPAYAIAKLLGKNAQVGNFARPPAGYNYGVITGIEGISETCEGSTRKTLSKYKINPIKVDSDGYIVWNCLTSQAANSSFSDTYVVMSFLAMKYGIKDSLNGYEFEFNDPETVAGATRILEGLGRTFCNANYAQEIKVDNSKNVYGSEEILIYFNVRFKKAAKFLTIKLVVHPSDQSLEISLAS